MYYFSVNEKNIVDTLMTSPVPINQKDYDREYIEVPKNIRDINSIMGMKWNGSTFEEVPQKEIPKEITMEDLNKKLDLIISHLGIKAEDHEEKV